MKSLSLKLILLILVFIGYSCEDPDTQQVQPNKSELYSGRVEKTNSNERYGGFRFCIYDIQFGRKIYFPGHGLICSPAFSGICSFRIVDCFYWIDPCLFPCGIEIIDPWEVFEKIDPRELISIPDKMDLKIDPKQTMIPFPVNKNVLGLQFYDKIEGALNAETLILENDIELDPEFVKENGLNGNIIPSGKYPVAVNPENKTYNAFVSLREGKIK